MQNSRLLSALVGIGSLGFAASHAAAAGTTATTLFDSGGFEPSAGYVTGSLPQYNGSSTGNGAWTSAVNQVQGTTNYPLATVQTFNSSTVMGAPYLNQQYVDVTDQNLTPISADGSSGNYGYYNPQVNVNNPFVPSATNGQQVAVRWTMEIENANANHPFFGITSFGNGSSQPFAIAGIDASTGLVYGLPSTFQASQGTFYQYELLLDYSTNTYSFYEAPATVGSAFTLIGAAPFRLAATNFTDADITTYVPFGVGATGTGSGEAAFDNYSVQVLPVPEPASAGALALALLGLAGRRKSRSSVDAGASR